MIKSKSNTRRELMLIADKNGNIIDITEEEFELIFKLRLLAFYWIELVPYFHEGATRYDLGKNLFPNDYQKALEEARKKRDSGKELILEKTLFGDYISRKAQQRECEHWGNCRYGFQCSHYIDCSIREHFEELEKEKIHEEELEQERSRSRSRSRSYGFSR